jgi:hypothetical protein
LTVIIHFSAFSPFVICFCLYFSEWPRALFYIDAAANFLILVNFLLLSTNWIFSLHFFYFFLTEYFVFFFLKVGFIICASNFIALLTHYQRSLSINPPITIHAFTHSFISNSIQFNSILIWFVFFCSLFSLEWIFGVDHWKWINYRNQCSPATNEWK